jgi:hypothetical protein
MAFATINNPDPLVIPARAARTYSKLDVKEIKITRNGDHYALRATFLPHDSDNDATLKNHKLTWLVSDLVTYLSDKPAARTTVIDFVKGVAAQAQADPGGDRPQPPPQD